MDIKVKKQLQNSMLEINIEEKEDKEALAKALVFTQPDYCPLCKGKNIAWEANKVNTDDGTFTYIKRKCLNKDCLASSTLGEYKSGGFFWKPWEIYKKNGGGNQTPPIKDQEDEINVDDIPF